MLWESMMNTSVKHVACQSSYLHHGVVQFLRHKRGGLPIFLVYMGVHHFDPVKSSVVSVLCNNECGNHHPYVSLKLLRVCLCRLDTATRAASYTEGVEVKYESR